MSDESVSWLFPQDELGEKAHIGLCHKLGASSWLEVCSFNGGVKAITLLVFWYWPPVEKALNNIEKH